MVATLAAGVTGFSYLSDPGGAFWRCLRRLSHVLWRPLSLKAVVACQIGDQMLR